MNLGELMENISISRVEYLELLRYKEMISVLEELIHERKFKEEFVRRVLEAEKRVAKGEKATFKSMDEMSKYLENMKD